jgi:hypothetical protein
MRQALLGQPTSIRKISCGGLHAEGASGAVAVHSASTGQCNPVGIQSGPQDLTPVSPVTPLAPQPERKVS